MLSSFQPFLFLSIPLFHRNLCPLLLPGNKRDRLEETFSTVRRMVSIRGRAFYSEIWPKILKKYTRFRHLSLTPLATKSASPATGTLQRFSVTQSLRAPQRAVDQLTYGNTKQTQLVLVRNYRIHICNSWLIDWFNHYRLTRRLIDWLVDWSID